MMNEARERLVGVVETLNEMLLGSDVTVDIGMTSWSVYSFVEVCFDVIVHSPSSVKVLSYNRTQIMDQSFLDEISREVSRAVISRVSK